MEIVNNPTQAEVKRAAQALRDGHLVAFPTETVYGLGADATNEKAVSRIYSVKGRPTNHPLIVHISSIAQLDKWAIDIPKYALNLAEEFWPGSMTLILKRSKLAKNFVTGSQGSVGIRVPAHSLAIELISELEKLGKSGIAAPSANKFGAVSPTTAEAVSEELAGNLIEGDMILDGGKSRIGIESTIIDCTGVNPVILRPGAVNLDMVTKITGTFVDYNSGEYGTRTSGNFKKHYSPKARVVIGTNTKPGEGFIAMSNISTPIGAIRLASPKTILEYAQVFYSALRMADKMRLAKVCVYCPEGQGLEVAIRDRLHKAASS
jgi:L-threonylcarbamoyladenylate synthase